MIYILFFVASAFADDEYNPPDYDSWKYLIGSKNTDCATPDPGTDSLGRKYKIRIEKIEINGVTTWRVYQDYKLNQFNN